MGSRRCITRNLIDAFGKFDAPKSEVSHRLLHYRVGVGYTSADFVFASEYVQDTVYKRLYRLDKRKLLSFIQASEGVDGYAVLRGHLFEGHVHLVLARGGRFQIRRFVAKNEVHNAARKTRGGVVPHVASETGEWIELSRRQTTVFKNNAELAAAGDVYLRPLSKNYQSVDAILKPDVLFQVTGAHKHPCKQAGLHNVLEQLGDPVSPRLYFVVPPDRFKDFEYQKYHDSRNKVMENPTYANVQNIQQFVLQIELTPEES